MGTACTKNAGEVAGTNRSRGGKKAPAARAPVRSVAIVARGRCRVRPEAARFRQEISKATKQLALRKALSERLKAGDVIVVERHQVEFAKTREFIGLLSALRSRARRWLCAARPKELAAGVAQRACASRCRERFADTYQVLRFDKLLFTAPRFEQVDQRLAGKSA